MSVHLQRKTLKGLPVEVTIRHRVVHRRSTLVPISFVIAECPRRVTCIVIIGVQWVVIYGCRNWNLCLELGKVSMPISIIGRSGRALRALDKTHSTAKSNTSHLLAMAILSLPLEYHA